MTFRPTLLAAAACVAALSSGAALAATHDFTVNGQTVSKAQQEALIRQYTDRGQVRTPQLENQVRMLLTRDQVLLQKAKKDKLAERDDVRRMVENAEKNILMSTVINDWIAKNPVTEDAVRKAFDENHARWGDKEVLVRHILVKDKKTADSLLRRIKKGEDFAKLAQENSIDTEQNRANGGLIDWNSPKVFEEDFASSFAKLKVGQVTSKPVQTNLGWHIVKLEGSRKAERWVNYEAEAPALRQLLTQQRVQMFVDKLIKEAKISDSKK